LHRSPVLAVDLGGSKTDLALIAADDPRAIVRRATFPSREARSFDEILDRFLGSSAGETVAAAAIGVAGPVRDGRCRVTNLSWDLDEGALSARLGAPVVLVNDLVALAHGLPFLNGGEFDELQAGVADPAGTALLVAVGTGLGVSILAPGDGANRNPLPSEGGHVELAARDDLEARLLGRIRAQFGRVEAERVLSGSGCPNLYFALRDERPELALAATDTAVRCDGSAALARAAEAGDRLAEATLDLWASWLGSVVGDHALTTLATGGIYLAGGVAQKNAGRLRAPNFLAGFVAKDPFSQLLRGIPVRLVLAPETPLWGAAALASQRARR
jgi:glucokinase